MVHCEGYDAIKFMTERLEQAGKTAPVTGWPVMTILRGKVVAEEGKILAEPGDGSFLRRGLSPYAAPSHAA
jgi:hypothetical protein